MKVYIDGTDARYHIPDDFGGIRVFFSEESAKANLSCWEECGIVEVELDTSNPRVVVEENWELAMKNAVSGDEIIADTIKSAPKEIWKILRSVGWALSSLITSRYYRIRNRFRNEK